MRKQNCWEITGCGRGPDGVKAREEGACPTARELVLDGVNDGRAGGRLCWSVAGTMCGDRITCEWALQRMTCVSCPVFRMIRREQGDGFRLLRPGQNYRRARREKVDRPRVVLDLTAVLKTRAGNR
jgi:hypothetical protein